MKRPSRPANTDQIKAKFEARVRGDDPAYERTRTALRWLAGGWGDEFDLRDLHLVADPSGDEVERPLNLDPGYLSEAKLVLATTKDRDHRIYLGQGIFAECTLYFHKQQWQPRDWTYPDFCSTPYRSFLAECRDYLGERYRQGDVEQESSGKE